MNNRSEFLERRKKGIGGSDVAAILGISKWKTPYQIWEDKTGRSVAGQQTDAQYFGTMLEQFVADEFVRRKPGWKVQKRNLQFESKEHPELIANIDRYVVGGAILECKTASTSRGWGENGSDQIPDFYMTQVQHYMYVTGYRMAYLAVLISEFGHEFRIYEIPYNAGLAEFQAERCVAWWAAYVVPDMPPPVTVRDDLASIYPGNAGEVKVADDEAAELIQNYAMVSALCKSEFDRKKELAAQINLFCGNAETITDDHGRVLLTNRRCKDSVTTVTDWEAVCRELCSPDQITEEIIKKHTAETIKAGTRRLIVKAAKN